MPDAPRQTAEAAVAGVFGDPALESVLAETGALFHRMRHEAERIHGQGETSSGRRAILRGLARLGPQTVPEMARARPVSRQYIQRLVNELTDDGLVEAAVNPAHKRSALIQITNAGAKTLDEMSAREQELFEGIQIDIEEEDLAKAADTLRRLRLVFEGADWQSRIAAAEENDL